MTRSANRQTSIDWRTLLINQVLFPLHETLKRHQTIQVHQSLMKTQWMSLEPLCALQAHKLRHFLLDITQNVPYYKNHHGAIPLDMGIEELSTWPFLTKSLIRQHQASLIRSDKPTLQNRSTGGSTGEPLQFLLGKKRISVDVAQKWRATRWWGVDIGDKELVVWASAIESKSQSLLKRFRDYCFRSEFHSAQFLDEAKAVACLKRIQQFKPKMLFGYPSLLTYLAQTAQHHSLTMPDTLQVAFVTSEMLEPFQRQIIEQTFDCRVANGYGGRESGFIAHECPSGQMHLSYEDIVVEIIDSNGVVLPQNSVGEIVVTHLATREFPFVRYRTGDIGSISYEPCVCGRGLPVLKNLQGRLSDLLLNHKKEIIHRSHIIQCLSQCKHLNQFRFEQMSYDYYKLFYSGKIDLTEINLLNSKLKSLIGEHARLDWIACDTLPRDLSGKHRFIVSHITSNVSHQELLSA